MNRKRPQNHNYPDPFGLGSGSEHHTKLNLYLPQAPLTPTVHRIQTLRIHPTRKSNQLDNSNFQPMPRINEYVLRYMFPAISRCLLRLFDWCDGRKVILVECCDNLLLPCLQRVQVATSGFSTDWITPTCLENVPSQQPA